MIPVSAKWAPALRANHQPTSRVEVWRTSSQLIPELRIESATIGKDSGAYPRTTASVTVADLSPSTAQLLTPFGSRLKFYSGIKYFDNTTEMILIADLDIVSSRLSLPAGTLELECADPSGLISAQDTGGPIRPASGDLDALTMLVWILYNRAWYYGERLPSMPGGTPASPLLPADWNIDGDPWDAIEQLADSMGYECYFGPDRRPVLRPTPVLAATPVAQLYTGAGGSVTVLESGLSRATNILYLYGAPDAAGVVRRGVASDNADPSSPTYAGGAYGRVITRESRPVIFATAGQANAAAASLLSRMQGRVRSLDLQAVTDPSIEPGDTVGIRFTGGTVEKHIVGAVEIPLGAGEMRVRTGTTAYTSAGWP